MPEHEHREPTPFERDVAEQGTGTGERDGSQEDPEREHEETAQEGMGRRERKSVRIDTDEFGRANPPENEDLG
jgi:hypothetical protein